MLFWCCLTAAGVEKHIPFCGDFGLLFLGLLIVIFLVLSALRSSRIAFIVASIATLFSAMRARRAFS